jgi:malate synthase
MKDRIELTGPRVEDCEDILTPAAVGFVTRLASEFAEPRSRLLAARRERRLRFAAGELPDFPAATAALRDDPSWRVAEAPADLRDRRVEITGPTDAKMTINALNSGARVWLADFEDATTPSWHNLVTGQRNLREAIDRRLTWTSPDGRHYRLPTAAEGPLPTIVARPRGWHLPEKHVLVNGAPISGALFDAGMYLFHCARRQLARGSGPYLYLPKLESAAEAALWNDVFCYAQDALGLPRGTIRATVLVETITAAFEMEEILYALREHVCGLNAGRWDYIFSVIKNFGTRPEFVLPDRAAVTMTVPFMRAYTEQLVRVAHRRGAHAIGGMAAFIPNRRDIAANERALAQVARDKEREAADGFDGSWVAHPDLVPVCRNVFDGVLGARPHQLRRLREDTAVSAADLLDVAATPGAVTAAGVRSNVAVALRYVESWLRGQGAVGVFGLMEDVATAEIARSQLWQWIYHGTPLSDGGVVSRRLVAEVIDAELAAFAERLGPDGYAETRFEDARRVIEHLCLGQCAPAFLTTEAYGRYLVRAPVPPAPRPRRSPRHEAPRDREPEPV